MHELNLKASDDVELFGRLWIPDNPRGGVILVHGLGEHGGRYGDFPGYFLERNIALCAPDLRGHGKSGGRRGDFSNIDVLLKDIELFQRHLEAIINGKPIFLYGHSMGGTVALLFAEKSPNISGAVITSPWLKLVNPPTRLSIALAKLLDRIAPGLTLSNGIRSEELSGGESESGEYDSDPLVHDRISVRAFLALREAASHLRHDAVFASPLLFMHGTADPITSYRATMGLASETESPFLTWPGFLHEIHREPGGEKSLAAAASWIGAALE